MSEFIDIFEEVLRIVTVQPRRIRYRLPEWEERMQVPERTGASMVGDRSRTTKDLL